MISTETMIQMALDDHTVERREDLPAMNQDGSIEDEESLREWLLAHYGYPSEIPWPGDPIRLDLHKLVDIVASILAALESDRDWSMDTLDSILACLQCDQCRLYEVDAQGHFIAKTID